jgi:hypothetical protein
MPRSDKLCLLGRNEGDEYITVSSKLGFLLLRFRNGKAYYVITFSLLYAFTITE